MTPEQVVRRSLVLSLIEVASQLSVRPGAVSATYCRDCWSVVADLELGCPCEESALAMLGNARRFLGRAA